MSELGTERLDLLRRFPLGRRPNKVGLAIELARTSQAETSRATGLVAPYISDVVRGRYRNPKLENLQKFAAFFGCQIEDLFPARDREAVAS